MHMKGGPSACFLLVFHAPIAARAIKSCQRQARTVSSAATDECEAAARNARRPYGVEVWQPPEGRSEVNRPVFRPCQEIGQIPETG